MEEVKFNTMYLPVDHISGNLIYLIFLSPGTNLNYYPDDCRLLATDHWDDAKTYLDQNFPDEEEEHRIKLDRCDYNDNN